MKLRELLKREAAKETRSAFGNVAAEAVDCPTQPQGSFACAKYKLIVTADICRRCASSPEFKQSLYASYIRNRAARALPCWHRGPQVAEIEAPCCGGKRKVKFTVHVCSQTGQRVSDPDCWLCPHYDPQGGKT